MELSRAAIKPGYVLEDGLEDRMASGARSDPAAFAWLYEQHVERVYRYLRGRGASPDDATELTALTFERALRHIDRYRTGESGFGPWLLRIARNAFIDETRRRRPEPLDEAASFAAPGSSPEDQAIDSEERRWIRGLVAALPETQRDALALRFAVGLTSREIAAVIGKSEAATKKLLTRAIAALKEETRHGA
jgi:RNA polymerase sigma-70 factor (ECF subfamily)